MQKSPIPDNEAARLQALHQLNLLDTAAEERFDRITRLAAAMLQTPVARVSLVDRDRQWFKSSTGSTDVETPRDISFCGHAIMDDAPFIVPDARMDKRFEDNPLVTGESNVRFYAGVPLRAAGGHNIGSLCVLDHQPRQLDDQGIAILTDLAAMVEKEINLQSLVSVQEELLAAQRKIDRFFSMTQDLLCIMDLNGGFQRINAMWSKTLGCEPTELMSRPLFDAIHYADREATQREWDRLRDGGQDTCSLETRYACHDGSYRWLLWNLAIDREQQLVYGVVRDNTKRKEMLEALEHERQKSERLLLNILPRAIADRLKNGEPVGASEIENASVLFVDIVGFTAWSATASPSHVVECLNEVFSMFDRISEKFGLEKIKTIGDAYMAVCGVLTPRPDHAEAVANAALAMLAALHERNGRHPSAPREVKVGIASGRMIASVIGTKKFSYDVWGDTVNIASRMQSQGKAGAIQVARSTFVLLQDKFRFEEQGLVTIRGRGELPAYLLLGARHEDCRD